MLFIRTYDGASFIDIKKRAVIEATGRSNPSNRRFDGIYARTAGRDCVPCPSPLVPRLPLASRRTYYAGRVLSCMIIVFLSSSPGYLPLSRGCLHPLVPVFPGDVWTWLGLKNRCSTSKGNGF